MIYSLVLENGRVTEKLEIAGTVYTREAARLDENTTTYSDEDFCERIARDNIADEDFCDKVYDVLDSKCICYVAHVSSLRSPRRRTTSACRQAPGNLSYILS